MRGEERAREPRWRVLEVCGVHGATSPGLPSALVFVEIVRMWAPWGPGPEEAQELVFTIFTYELKKIQ